MGLLRVLLAMAVVLAHSDDFFGIKLTGGVVAVQLFFIISGFYMFLILDIKYQGLNSYWLFISNRMLKIFPIYFLVLFLTIIVSVVSGLLFNNFWELEPYLKKESVLSIGGIVYQVLIHIILYGQDLVLFLGVDTVDGSLYFLSDFKLADIPYHQYLIIPQAWTLALELMFYFLAPFLALRSTRFLVFIIALSLSARFYTYYSLGLDSDPWIYRFFPFELALFLMGAVSYRIFKCNESFFNFKGSGVVSVFFIVLIILSQYLNLDYEITKWFLYLMFTCLFLPLLFSVTRFSKWDARLGELSFPIYISHIFLLMFVSQLTKFLSLGGFNGETLVFAVIVFSLIINKYVSDPIESYRKKRINC